MRKIAKKQEIVRIRDALENLPVEQRVAVVAHYYDGFEIYEIAELMECSENMVNDYIYYAGLALKMEYRSCVLTPSVLYSASEKLLSSKAYKMTVIQAGMVHKSICNRLGLN